MPILDKCIITISSETRPPKGRTRAILYDKSTHLENLLFFFFKKIKIKRVASQLTYYCYQYIYIATREAIQIRVYNIYVSAWATMFPSEEHNTYTTT